MIAQIVVTTILSFVGFVALFNALGFQIVPPKQIAGITIPSGAESFSVQSVPPKPRPTAGGYTIKCPGRKRRPSRRPVRPPSAPAGRRGGHRLLRHDVHEIAQFKLPVVQDRLGVQRARAPDMLFDQCRGARGSNARSRRAAR